MATKRTGEYPEFDIIKFCEDNGIYYRTTGKNIGKDWIGIECPYCEGSGEHGGISMPTKKFSCFQCGEKRTAMGLVATLLRLEGEWSQVGKIMNRYLEGRDKRVYADPLRYSDKIIWPSKVESINKVGKKYLKSRGYNPDWIESRYGVKQTPYFSQIKISEQEKLDFKHRLVIPIIMNNKIVSYSGRDITGHQDPRYKHAPIEASIIPAADCWYNIDSVTNKAIIVEGPTDVWKFGDECIGLHGKKFTSFQLSWLAQHRKLKKVVVLFDEGGDKEADKLAIELATFIPKVQVLCFESGDPGDMEELDAMILKRELLG